MKETISKQPRIIWTPELLDNMEKLWKDENNQQAYELIREQYGLTDIQIATKLNQWDEMYAQK